MIGDGFARGTLCCGTLTTMPSQADQDITLPLEHRCLQLVLVWPWLQMTVWPLWLMWATKLWQPGTKISFFAIVGHGFDPSIIGDAFAASEDFFAQPLEAKQEQLPLDMSINCGFEHFAQVRPSTGVADQKESLQVTARKDSMDSRWLREGTFITFNLPLLMAAVVATESRSSGSQV